MLNALDASTGKMIWSHNTSTDTSREVPFWGISSSPLVVDDVVIVSRVRHAHRIRHRHRQAALGRPDARRQLQLAAPRHDRRRDAGRDPERARRGQRRIPPTASCCGNTSGRAARSSSRRSPSDGDILINAMSATGGVGTRRLVIKHDGADVDARRALDHERVEAVLQRLRHSQGPRLRLRRQHPRVHRSRRRQAQVERRALRQRTDDAARRPGPAAGDVGRRRARAGQRDARSVQGDRADSRSSTPRPGTTRWSSATCCWSGTARRWRRSACRRRTLRPQSTKRHSPRGAKAPAP